MPVSCEKAFKFSTPVVLVGAGSIPIALVKEYQGRQWPIVCADGAADVLEQHGIPPDMIIGDMDSVLTIDHWRTRTRVLELSEQDTTDFEKCLYSTEAPLYLACGFTGDRLDHTLASLHVLQKFVSTRRVVMTAGRDICIARNADLSIALAADVRFSIYPLSRTFFKSSSGLEYPLDGLTLEQGSVIGTSNRTVAGQIELKIESGEYALILPSAMLPKVLESFNL